MTQEIIPDRQTIKSCLSKKTYLVDFYQRRLSGTGTCFNLDAKT